MCLYGHSVVRGIFDQVDAASMRGFAEAEGVARAKVDTIEAELGDLRERIGQE